VLLGFALLASACSEDEVPPSGGSPDMCHLEGIEVGVIGDSYIHLSGDITRFVQDHARAAGALSANENYIDHSFSGASMNGFLSIPDQYPAALAEAKDRGADAGLQLVIMTGGGNDVLIDNRACLELSSAAAVASNASCKKTVDDSVATSKRLFQTMAQNGVKHVIYFFYPRLPEGGLAGSYPNSVLEYSYPLVRESCESQTALKCHFIDTRPAFEGKQSQYIGSDGVHPTSAGSKVIADLVWDVMQDNCLASER
jgi:lysophospholipase L1-like esterase